MKHQLVCRSSNEEHGYQELNNLLVMGYTVIMVNKLTNGKKEWLEYVLEIDKTEEKIKKDND